MRQDNRILDSLDQQKLNYGYNLPQQYSSPQQQPVPINNNSTVPLINSPPPNPAKMVQQFYRHELEQMLQEKERVKN